MGMKDRVSHLVWLAFFRKSTHNLEIVFGRRALQR